ncbi:hypothetical protein [Fulvivirga ligni]|uniref:hypothetical protein n=1 Tax=Fulvivirga ligni TaxID=2904246 RepID=UPI001F2478EB|nr:hypothetical protein [Fulvivirga ligni]UII21414.1 hypothetical protein LVD16_26660 [Fulvivirga ligni]
MYQLLQVITLILIYQNSNFTGKVTYDISGSDILTKEEYVLGEDFILKRTEGKITQVLGIQNVLYDIKNRKQYNILEHGKRIEIDTLHIGGVTKFHDFKIADTTTYHGRKCKIITFNQYGSYNQKSYYKYYYDLDQTCLAMNYQKVGDIFNGQNTIFRPFEECSLPYRIEINYEDDKKKPLIIQQVDFEYQNTDRTAIFQNLGI